jgi:hypothetical protein
MVGGGAYVAGKHRAQSQQQEQDQAAYQDQRISALEQQGQPAAAQPQAAVPQQPAAAAPAAGGGSIVDKLKQLTDMKAAGALNDQEFEAAKAQLLGGG